MNVWDIAAHFVEFVAAGVVCNGMDIEVPILRAGESTGCVLEGTDDLRSDFPPSNVHHQSLS